MSRSGHSRVTGVLRLVLALWLMGSAVRALAEPWQAVAEQGMPMAVGLPFAGLSFTVGAFLLTRFMSRRAGLLVGRLGVCELALFGVSVPPAVAVGACALLPP